LTVSVVVADYFPEGAELRTCVDGKQGVELSVFNLKANRTFCSSRPAYQTEVALNGF